MREILFRGQDADSNEWRYGYYAHFEDMHGVKANLIYTGYADVHMGNLLTDCHDVKPETVGQYTGLTDKNGVKIFEGDVLEGDLDDNLDPGAKWRCTVVWGKFGWLCKARQTCPMDEFDIREGEVIGNIYDNPELMGDKKNGRSDKQTGSD